MQAPHEICEWASHTLAHSMTHSLTHALLHFSFTTFLSALAGLLCCPHSLCGLSPESTFSSADDWVWSLMRCCDAQVAAGGWAGLS